jgi:hypothetical protein
MEMNRHERRKARKGSVTCVDYGRLSPQDCNYGLPVECYVCGRAHNALGLARIRDKRGTTDVPLCKPCLDSDDQTNAVLRKYWNAPGLKIRDGGQATGEQVVALVQKQNSTAH